MRTTLNISDSLLAAAKRRAAEKGTTLTSFVEGALAAALAQRASRDKAFRLNWQTHRGRLLPGVDIADRERLFDIMERDR